MSVIERFGNWIGALSLYPTDEKNVDIMYSIDGDGFIRKNKLNVDTMESSLISTIDQPMVPDHIPGNIIDLQINPYDPRIFLVLEKHFCEVFQIC